MRLFFSSDFKAEFFGWKRRLQVGSILPHNKKQIADGLRDMSPESIRYRFLGSKKEFTERELEYLTVLDGKNHYALGIQEVDGLKRGIAVIRLVRSSERKEEAEVAVTIIDEYQKKGLGLFLLRLVMLAALERKMTRLSFTYLPANEGIVRLIKKAGNPIPGTHTRDYDQLYLDLKDLDIENVKAQLAPILPAIGTFRLGT